MVIRRVASRIRSSSRTEISASLGGFVLGATSSLLVLALAGLTGGADQGLMLLGFLIGLFGLSCGFLAQLEARTGRLGDRTNRTEEPARAESGWTPSLPAPSGRSASAPSQHVAQKTNAGSREFAGERSTGGIMGEPAQATSDGAPAVDGTFGHRAHSRTFPDAASFTSGEEPQPFAASLQTTVPGSATRDLDTGALVLAWQDYLDQGDGRFNEAGLRSYLDRAGICAEILGGRDLGVDDSILAVVSPGARQGYLLPNFNRPVRAVEEWFVDQDGGERMARVSRLLEVAVIELGGEELRLVKKGVVA